MSSFLRIQKIPSTANRTILSIVLDRPKALNALNLEMLQAIRAELERAEADESVAISLITSSNPERAFCAGGDVRELGVRLQPTAPEGLAAGRDFADNYFAIEFSADESIYGLKKPVVALVDGICMGGGIGLIAGMSHRVMTPNTLLAMPEVAIGYYPDVGSIQHLNRRPGNLGRFLGLSGARFSGADARSLGIASHVVPKEALAKLPEILACIDWATSKIENRVLVDEALDEVCLTQREDLLALAAAEDPIEALFSGNSFVDFWERCQVLLSQKPAHPILRSAAELLPAACPLSIRIAYEQLGPKYRGLGLHKIFEIEWHLAINFARHPDFAEGVRALLIDKDKKPRWTHSSPLDVRESDWAQFFQKPASTKYSYK